MKRLQLGVTFDFVDLLLYFFFQINLQDKKRTNLILSTIQLALLC